jgi:hypothetical protein
MSDMPSILGSPWQLVSLAGAALVLIAFAGSSFGKITPNGRAYNAFNFFGSSALFASAVAAGQWGFLILNGVWALVSLRALFR